MSDHYEDGIVCESEEKTEKIWKIREGISMATAHNGFVRLIKVMIYRQLNSMSVSSHNSSMTSLKKARRWLAMPL